MLCAVATSPLHTVGALCADGWGWRPLRKVPVSGIRDIRRRYLALKRLPRGTSGSFNTRPHPCAASSAPWMIRQLLFRLFIAAGSQHNSCGLTSALGGFALWRTSLGSLPLTDSYCAPNCWKPPPQETGLYSRPWRGIRALGSGTREAPKRQMSNYVVRK